MLLAIFGVWKTAHLAPVRMPGTKSGEHQMLVYSLGGPPVASEAPLHSTKSLIHAPATKAKPQPPAKPAEVTKSAPTSPGVGGSGDSALGEGNITIALERFHPRPTPDLSSLPHGTAGDVVLDATIDDKGKVTQLKVTKGFGGTIDQTVIATVQQWTFTPALKDGVPISSEREILFHYEHS
jgi:protein TonB